MRHAVTNYTCGFPEKTGYRQRRCCLLSWSCPSTIGRVTAGAPMRRIRRQVIPGFGPEQIAAARMRLGLNQEEMAQHAGVPLRTYASWERGEVTPTAAKPNPLIGFLESNGIDPRDPAMDDAEAGIPRDRGLTDRDKAAL